MPTFIDKPFTCSLAKAKVLSRLAIKKKAPLFSSSSLRYAIEIQRLKSSIAEVGSIVGADAYSPASLHPANPGLFHYGIHAVETLYALMGPGCKSVWCVYDESCEVVTGLWLDGRIGVVRGTRRGPHGYGFTAFCEKQVVSAQINTTFIYRELLNQMVKMFQTGRAPLNIAETIEIVAFIEAALDSAKNYGRKTALAFSMGMK
jgi:predicted dehydrogenase